MKKLSVSIMVQVFALSLFVFALPFAGTGPASKDFFVNGGFETGTWAGWNVGGVCYLGNSTVHSGQFSAYVSDLVFDSWISQTFFPATRLRVGDGLVFNGWIFPMSVGPIGLVKYPFSTIRFYFVNGSSGAPALMVSYDWCWNEYENNVTTPITFLLDFRSNEWNLLSRNITSDIYSFYGNIDYSDIFLSYVTCLYHYSVVSPGAFYVDDLALTTSAEAPQVTEVTMFRTNPAPYVQSNETRINEPVIVKANATNSGQVVLKFRKQAEEWFNVSMIYNASERLWVQTIPGQVENCTIEFKIETFDMNGFGTTTMIYSYAVKQLRAGDINGDGKVDIFDAILLAMDYGKT